MNQDRILVALCAAFVCFVLAEFIANFGRLAVVILFAIAFLLILCSVIWWWQLCKQNYLKRFPTPTRRT